MNEILPAVQKQFDAALVEGKILTLDEASLWADATLKELCATAGE